MCFSDSRLLGFTYQQKSREATLGFCYFSAKQRIPFDFHYFLPKNNQFHAKRKETAKNALFCSETLEAQGRFLRLLIQTGCA